MDFINNISLSKNIPKDRIKLIDSGAMQELTSKIKLSDFNELRNKIYWASELLYSNSYLFYFNNMNMNKQLTFNPNNMIMTYPMIHISSELCKLFNAEYLYTTLSSILIRQAIEHYCLDIECKIGKVSAEKIFKAAICSHNIHVGASIEGIFPDLQTDNIGLFKVINNKIRLTKLAKKHNYEFAYKLFSGDSHLISTIEKQIPNVARSKKSEKIYELIYLQSLFSLICDINEYYLQIINGENLNIKDSFRIQIKDK